MPKSRTRVIQRRSVRRRSRPGKRPSRTSRQRAKYRAGTDTSDRWFNPSVNQHHDRLLGEWTWRGKYLKVHRNDREETIEIEIWLGHQRYLRGPYHTIFKNIDELDSYYQAGMLHEGTTPESMEELHLIHRMPTFDNSGALQQPGIRHIVRDFREKWPNETWRINAGVPIEDQ